MQTDTSNMCWFHGKLRVVLPEEQKELKGVWGPGVPRPDCLVTQGVGGTCTDRLLPAHVVSSTYMGFHIFLNYKFILKIGRFHINHLYLTMGSPLATCLSSLMTRPASGTHPMSFVGACHT